jgi:hypothetical protein
MALTTEQVATLEGLVDNASLSEVLVALSDICRDKADHIAVNWQDNVLAKAWRGAAEGVLSCSGRVAIVRVSPWC